MQKFKFAQKLENDTNIALTTSLITLALVTVFVALFAPKLVKAGFLLWEVLP